MFVKMNKRALLLLLMTFVIGSCVKDNTDSYIEVRFNNSYQNCVFITNIQTRYELTEDLFWIRTFDDYVSL